MYKILLLPLTAGCLGGDVSITPTKTDDVGDGYTTAVDCDDSHAVVHPDAEEVCDALDNDCNGEVDDDPSDAINVYADTDADGYGDPESGLVVCVTPRRPRDRRHRLRRYGPRHPPRRRRELRPPVHRRGLRRSGRRRRPQRDQDVFGRLSTPAPELFDCIDIYTLQKLRG